MADCGGVVVARGWCQKHYQRWWLHGDVNRGRRTTEESFWLHVTKTETCWLWTGHRMAAGYGLFGGSAKTHLAHRVAWELLRGEITEGLQLDHLCRVTACVNPDHLEPVTPAVNILRSEAWSAKNARKTHCKNGHPLPPAFPYQRRTCVPCLRVADARYRARKAAIHAA